VCSLNNKKNNSLNNKFTEVLRDQTNGNFVNLLSDIGRATASMLSIALGTYIPIGLLVVVAQLAYRLWKKNIFDLPLEELEREKIKTDEKVKALEEELKYLEELRVAKCRSDTECEHLVIKITGLKEQLKILKYKLYVIDIVEYVKKNERLFKEQLGSHVWKKVVENPDKFKEEVEKRLPEVDVEALRQIAYQLVVSLETEREKPKEAELTLVKENKEEKPTYKPQLPEVAVVEQRLLIEGTINEWISFLNDALNKKVSVKLPDIPPSKYINEKGFRNLLMALLKIDIGKFSASQLFKEEKHINKIATLIIELKEGIVRVKPTDSKKADIDQIINILTGGEASEVKEYVKNDIQYVEYVYRFKDPEGKELTITKTIQKTPSGIAREITYKLS